MPKKLLIALCLAPLALLLNGCVTHITTDVYQNPAPAEKFSNFNRIELSPARLEPPYAGQGANEAALIKIQENIDLKMKPALATWNAAPVSGAPRTLQIDLTIPEIKFISGGNRFWGGAWAGSSAVKLNARITEKETGKVIATPQFYARAAAMGGAWTFGATDNTMLIRIANRLSDYLIANYPAAVGGPTGAEPPEK
jgi:hypothetical protein